jgi:Xaa-Pro aminopeptidase
MVRPGALGKEIHEAVHQEFSRRGFQSGLIEGRMQGFFHGTGHGVGLEIHELPRLGPKGIHPLQLNHVVTVEPGLYYRGWGGVRLEDLLLITETGSRDLTRYPQVFEIV